METKFKPGQVVRNELGSLTLVTNGNRFDDRCFCGVNLDSDKFSNDWLEDCFELTDLSISDILTDNPETKLTEARVVELIRAEISKVNKIDNEEFKKLVFSSEMGMDKWFQDIKTYVKNNFNPK